MKLKQDETSLIGKWEFIDSSAVADSVSKRIGWLISEYLIEITTDDSGWNKLF